MSSTSPSDTSLPSQSPPHRQIPAGFLTSNNRQSKQISRLSHRELLDLWNKNRRILAEPAPSTSTYHSRIMTEQAAIEAALGMEKLENGMKNTHIAQDETMNVSSSTSPQSRTVDAKRRAVGRYYGNTRERGTTAAMGLEEAMELERRAHVAALEKRKQELERRVEQGLPLPGEMLTRAEREARIWAYMNAKPTYSDEEDEESDEEDPSTWFDDEEDDERKGQPPFDLSYIIQVDEGRWG